MKKNILNIFIVVLISAFLSGVWVSPILAGEKDKYGGVFKIAYWNRVVMMKGCQ